MHDTWLKLVQEQWIWIERLKSLAKQVYSEDLASQSLIFEACRKLHVTTKEVFASLPLPKPVTPSQPPLSPQPSQFQPTLSPPSLAFVPSAPPQPPPKKRPRKRRRTPSFPQAPPPPPPPNLTQYIPPNPGLLISSEIEEAYKFRLTIMDPALTLDDFERLQQLRQDFHDSQRKPGAHESSSSGTHHHCRHFDSTGSESSELSTSPTFTSDSASFLL